MVGGKGDKPAKSTAAKSAKGRKKETGLGLTNTKDGNFGEWYSEVVTNGEMIEYYEISGCYILRPWTMAIWETMQNFFDPEIKKMNIKTCYFPLFVSNTVLQKEKDHIEGFAPEVAWVTRSGSSDLEVPIAIRPTSETVMYPYFSKWIRGHRDLPLRLNQWCNVVRWEFSNPTPFIRSREFLWQEGHTAFATKEEADTEVLEILELYRRLYEDYLAVPVVKGKKSELEKFAGGLYTTSVEAFIPNTGRGVQGATSHCLGQNFAKMFEINFEDEKGEKAMVWQNSWAYSTRTIGVMVMVHGDDKGLVLPPKISAVQVIVIHVPFKDADYSHWEMKGVPLRIEIGPKDLANNQVRAVRRDNGSKVDLPMADLGDKVKGMLDDIQESMFDVAKQKRDACIQVTNTWDEFIEALGQKKLILAPWCDEERKQFQGSSMVESRNSVKSLCLDGDWGCSMVHRNDNDVNWDNRNGRKGGNNDGKKDAVKVFDEIMFTYGLQPEIAETVRILKPKTLYKACCVAIMQEATNDLLRRRCNKIVDSNSVVLEVNHSLENEGNKMVTNKAKDVVEQDIGKNEDSNCGISVNKSGVSVVNESSEREPKRELGNGIVEDGKGYQIELSEVIDEGCDENVNGKKIVSVGLTTRDTNSDEKGDEKSDRKPDETGDGKSDEFLKLPVIDKLDEVIVGGNDLESNESSEVEVNWVVIADKFVHNDGNSEDIEGIWKWLKREKAGSTCFKRKNRGWNRMVGTQCKVILESGNLKGGNGQTRQKEEGKNLMVARIGIQMDACGKMESEKVLNKIEPLSCVLQHVKECMRKIGINGIHTEIGATRGMERILDTIKENHMASDQPLGGKFVKDRGKKNGSKSDVIEVNVFGRMDVAETRKDVKPGDNMGCNIAKVWNVSKKCGDGEYQQEIRHLNFYLDNVLTDKEECINLGIASGGNGTSSRDGNFVGIEVRNGKSEFLRRVGYGHETETSGLSSEGNNLIKGCLIQTRFLRARIFRRGMDCNKAKLESQNWKEVEKDVKAKTKGEVGAAKTLCSPFDQPELPEGTLCFASGKPAKKWTYWGRSY
uniref:proline--tRNA ligase n=1 Tax=Tanacetum cinerariifolium TaxID=118510 RepID=A0A6L2M1X1_TANCI|nr:proline--tRNA ligase, cytoplasmic [Tanacetum cinerariifolium]